MSSKEEMNQELVKSFIEYFKTLPESEQFKLGGMFNKETGGSLSPFNSPKPVAVGIIQVQDGDEIKLLGVKRNIVPFIGEDAFPGGYVNKFEDPFVAVAREVQEETGLVTDPADYEIYDAKNTDKNNILFFFKYKHVLSKEMIDNLVLSEEVLKEVQGFVLLDKESPICFSLHKEVSLRVLNELEQSAVNTKRPKIA